MRLVLDTNVVASALLWGGMPQRLLHAGREKRAELFTSTLLLAELIVTGDRSLLSVLEHEFVSSESARPCKHLPWLDRTTLWQPEKWRSQ